MTPIIVNGVCLGYSINFTGPQAECELVGDLAFHHSVMGPQPKQKTRATSATPKAQVVKNPTPEKPRKPCYQCGKPTTLRSGRLCPRCVYDRELEKGYRSYRKPSDRLCKARHGIRRSWCPYCVAMRKPRQAA